MKGFGVNLEPKLITLCGILGIWARNKAGEAQFKFLPQALSKLQHRGPDFQQIKIYTNVALGHTRLSILDLRQEANQPFSDITGKFHLIFNGEIYNFKEIRTKLQRLGVIFKTESDTEVLLHLLILKGEKALDDLNGFFSFVFYDVQNRVIVAARDRMGIKPLLYSEHDDCIIFSSELKPFLTFSIDKKIDEEALLQYFSYTYIPAPRTILRSVKKLLPGELIKITDGTIERKKYYDLTLDQKFSGDYISAKSELFNRLETSVSRRLISDVPLGCFLSGGLDSSIIAFLAKQQKADLNTFSVGFDHPYFNELPFADQMAKHIGTNHHNFIINKVDFKKEFLPFLKSMDEPFADSSAFAVNLLSARTKHDVSVALSGDGADELFGGYRKHRAEAKMRDLGVLKKLILKTASKIIGSESGSRSAKVGDFKRKIRKFSDAINFTADERYDQWCQWISQQDRQNLLTTKSSLSKLQFEITNMNEFLLVDQKFVLPNDMLKKVDQMSMAHSLEVRVPFLDHTFVEFVNSLPIDWKVNTQKTKIILRETFNKYLPKEILTRSKKGFEIPLQSWLNDEIETLFSASFFNREYLREQNLFSYEFIQELRSDWNEGIIGERIYLVWALLVFQNWYHQNLTIR